jgi:hypothetical protein
MDMHKFHKISPSFGLFPSHSLVLQSAKFVQTSKVGIMMDWHHRVHQPWIRLDPFDANALPPVHMLHQLLSAICTKERKCEE